MRRRTLLVSSAAVTTAALTGCIGSAQTETSEETRTITVSKSSEVAAEPDLAVIHVSVEATGETAATVRDELSTRSDRLYNGLLEAGIEADSISTSQYSIREQVDRQRLEQPEDSPQSDDQLANEIRYEGTHSFRIEVGDIDAVGDVVDTAVDSGADTVGWIEFTLSEEKRAEQREVALESALAAARNEAEFVATEVELSVVGVRNVDTADSGVSTVRQDAEFEDLADSSGSTALQPGDVTVRATVDVTYTIG
jgi:hypothetical protein